VGCRGLKDRRTGFGGVALAVFEHVPEGLSCCRGRFKVALELGDKTRYHAVTLTGTRGKFSARFIAHPLVRRVGSCGGGVCWSVISPSSLRYQEPAISPALKPAGDFPARAPGRPSNRRYRRSW